MSAEKTPQPTDSAPPPSDVAPSPSDQTPAPSEVAGSLPVPQDADDTRGYHFRRLMRKPLTLSLGSTAALAAFIGLTLVAGALIGAGSAAGVLLLVALIVFAIANSKAADDFYRAYAQGRGLQWNGDKERLPPVTPLLRKGDARYSENAFRGKLPGGMAGTLSLYTYEETTTDSKGNRQTSYYHFTVGLFDLPEASARINKLYCQRKSGFKFLEGAEDAFRKNKRIELESEAFADRYELFADADANDVWIRQVFSPKTIVWMTEAAPQKFGFELEAGLLCINESGHRESAAELDEFCQAATHVAGLIHTEAG